MMGVMQAELQERRNWLSNKEFVEGVALVNLRAPERLSLDRICAVFALRSTWPGGRGDGTSRLDAGRQLRHPVTSSGDQGMAPGR
jgi:hypothetical protein